MVTSCPAIAEFKALTTEDAACHFFYPTHKNTQGWYIKTSSSDMCQNGTVNKHGEVTIYNAFSEPVEQFYGFFNGGYWLGQTSLSADVISAKAENDSVYKVSFVLPNDTGFDIKYISQMSAQKQNNKTYGPFTFCAPFRILVQTEDFGLFKDKNLTTEIIDDIARQARRLCPTEQAIQLFGATKENPKQEDIFFYADINLQTAQIDVKRNEAEAFAKRFEDIKTKSETPLDTISLTDTALTTDSLHNTPSIIPTEIITPVPKTEQAQDLKNNTAVLDKVPHLLTLSRLTGAPVSGTAAVEISKVSDNTAVAIKPLPLNLTGDNLQTGWAIISGDFKHKTGKQASQLTGSVTISSFIPCATAYCVEIE